jgi:hypothetical protein
MSVTVTINNPSASAHLTIESQDLKTEQADAVTAQGVALVRDFNVSPTAEQRRELEERGAELVTHRVKDALGERDTTQPRFAASVFSSLSEWVTRAITQKNDAVDTAPVLRGVRRLNEWEEPRPFTAVAAHGSVHLTLHDRRRFIIKCGEPVVLQVSNPSHSNAIALKTRDSKTAHVSNSSIVHPARDFQSTGAVNTSKSQSAVIELMPT